MAADSREPERTLDTSEQLIRNALEASWSSISLRDALQVIADGVCDIAGFGVASVSVLHDSGDFEIVAISSDDPSVFDLIGHFNPEASIRAELDRAEDWGRFKYVPEEVQARIAPHTWVPDIAYPEEADAWHVEDLLIAPLHGDDGAIRGLLSVDIPDDGLIPGPDRRRILNGYAAQAERVLARALERERLTERVRLADAARAIVRRASVRMPAAELLEECREAILDGFHAQGMWLHVLPDPSLEQAPESLVTGAHGVGAQVPEELVRIGERAARESWAHQQVGIVSAQRATAVPITNAERDLAMRYLESIGVTSMLFVPLGAGTECLGNLVLTRTQGELEWSDAETATALDIGHDLGQALLNARLFEHDQRLVQRLRELDDYKSTLIATIAHEFKNPLTAIRGHVELLEEVLDEPTSVRWLAAIGRGANRLTDLVDSLLVLGRVSDPSHEADSQAIDLATVVRENLELFDTQARERRIRFEVRLPPHAVRVLAPSGDLDIVVSNLVSNALKYGPDGDDVQIVVEATTDTATLLIRDGGIGISEEDQGRLFEEFFRSHNPEAHAQPGTGLGLAIVARVVARLGGQISVSSELGRGSTFCVRLPIA